MLKIILVSALSITLIGCGSDNNVSTGLAEAKLKQIRSEQIRAENKARIEICVQKGHAYYDELGYGKGNYLLSNGYMRDDEVLYRCEKTNGGAFESFKPFCVDLSAREKMRQTLAKNDPTQLLPSLEKSWARIDREGKYPKCSSSAS